MHHRGVEQVAQPQRNPQRPRIPRDVTDPLGGGQAEVAKAQGRLEAFADEFSAILSRQIDERMAA